MYDNVWLMYDHYMMVLALMHVIYLDWQSSDNMPHHAVFIVKIISL